MEAALEKEDMQGILVSSYAHLPCVAYRLLRVVDGVAAVEWLRNLRGQITTAAKKDDRSSLNVALTISGLSALGLPPSALATFPAAFQDGMSSPRRSRVLGDAGPNAPPQWRWGGPQTRVDVLLMTYAIDEAEIARLLKVWEPGRGLEVVMCLQAGRQPDAREHFGFLDGVGQPVIEGSGRGARQVARTGHKTDVKPGEFVLGYENVYDVQPPMPSVEADDDKAGTLPPIGDPSGPHALGRNGSYLVFRQLSQDVPAFWRQMQKAGARVWPGDAEGAVRAAAKTVGGWPSGEPLVRSPQADPFDGVPHANPDNTFAYDKEDPHGDACPLGAHIRRANPRDALGPDPTTARKT
ncbi:MAG: peroxidase, partial [Gemmatimonadota bacterium]|nr:peroxidase [Gemmatimonadota bacterium]